MLGGVLEERICISSIAIGVWMIYNGPVKRWFYSEIEFHTTAVYNSSL